MYMHVNACNWLRRTPRGGSELIVPRRLRRVRSRTRRQVRKALPGLQRTEPVIGHHACGPSETCFFLRLMGKAVMEGTIGAVWTRRGHLGDETRRRHRSRRSHRWDPEICGLGRARPQGTVSEPSALQSQQKVLTIEKKSESRAKKLEAEKEALEARYGRYQEKLLASYPRQEAKFRDWTTGNSFARPKGARGEEDGCGGCCVCTFLCWRRGQCPQIPACMHVCMN